MSLRTCPTCGCKRRRVLKADQAGALVQCRNHSCGFVRTVTYRYLGRTSRWPW